MTAGRVGLAAAVARVALRPRLAWLCVGAVLFMAQAFAASAEAAGGSARDWGYNASGALGNGTTSSGGCDCIDSPVAVSGLSGATQLAGGLYHSLALLVGGGVEDWGSNSIAQLGDGSTTQSTTPVAVHGLSNAVAVAGGTGHSIALLSNGTVEAWGDNFHGELGAGSTSGPDDCGGLPCSKVPVAVPGLSGVVAIAADSAFSLALRSDGTVVAWGYNVFGVDGDGTGTHTGCDCVDRPTRVPGLSGVVAISAGQANGSALLRDGTVRDWGQNNLGQLGNGTTTTGTTCDCLGPVQVSGLSRVRRVAAGGYHGLALLSDGSVKAWGANHDGELGNGTTTTSGCQCSTTPVSVSGLSGVRAIAAGGEHSLALLSTGSVEAWGLNSSGQLGDGSTMPRDAPVPVSGLGGVSDIAAGDATGLALIGSTQTLDVSFAGRGAGTVGGRGILCPVSCQGRYAQDQVEILRADPNSGTAFAGFSGACTGTAPCQVRMSADRRVVATFGLPSGTRIKRAKLNKKKRSARFSFTASGAITGYQCALVKRRPRHHRRPRPHFSSCSSPKRYKHLKPGKYTFEVRAVDRLGVDPTPAKRNFKI